MTKYDPDVLQKFADSLYDHAAWIVWKCSIVGVVLGGLAVGLGAELLNRPDSAWWIGSIIAAAIGYSIGQGKAFKFRLEAQRTLCQMQIEYNTRRTAG